MQVPCLLTWGGTDVYAPPCRKVHSCKLGYSGCTDTATAFSLTAMWVHGPKYRPWACARLSKWEPQLCLCSVPFDMHWPACTGMHKHLCIFVRANTPLAWVYIVVRSFEEHLMVADMAIHNTSFFLHIDLSVLCQCNQFLLTFSGFSAIQDCLSVQSHMAS